MLYEEPKLEVLELTVKDIVCASTDPDDSNADDSPASGGW